VSRTSSSHTRVRTCRVLATFALVASGCARGNVAAPRSEQLATCTFVNPVAAGADPWVVLHDGTYYYVKSQGGKIWISSSKQLRDVVSASATPVWAAPDTGWNRSNLWAPELHHRDGRWYVYYAAGRAGPPYTSQHAGVLQSETADPFGRWIDRGMLYTGDSIGTGTGDRWSIDLTTTRIAGRDYAIWSGWAANAATDKTPQQLYIAPMSNPWTISGNRALLSVPDQPWERGPELDLLEGPEVLRHGGDVFIVYSTRDSWLKEYALGQLRLRDTTADPMNPRSWTKSGPVLTGNARVFGVGHASFTTSSDSTEQWIVFHTKDSATPGWKRSVHLQRFSWTASGDPAFGEAIPAGEPMRAPAGECR
jgi:GH43 family beta-xylosidase